MFRIGADIGSLNIKVVILDDGESIVHSLIIPHHGTPLQTFIARVLGDPVVQNLKNPRIGFTGSGSSLITSALEESKIDQTRARIFSVKKRFPAVRNIIDIGGSTAILLNLKSDGSFGNYVSNSLCAAGTGSFLDEQAIRLGISYDQMDSLPAVKAPPMIAGRCAVFAKSDLIHFQQEGKSREEMWSGLCRGMARTMLQTLLKGKSLKGDTVIIGGVSQNKEVLRWLREEYPEQINTYPEATLAAAEGAALLADCRMIDFSRFEVNKLVGKDDWGPEVIGGRAPLKLAKSVFLDQGGLEGYVFGDGMEVSVNGDILIPDSRIEAYLGVDVGSTSTKGVLINGDGKVLLDIYGKTKGSPISVTRELFNAIRECVEDRSIDLNILGMGTTGSGRTMIGKIVGADLIINEITAHVEGAVGVDPDIDTIFEIGGQDAKYVRIRGGRIFDSNMNFVCAAGTGSFIEEQAHKLGMRVEEIGDKVMGLVPPYTSDRCTVFIEQDIDRLLRKGYSPDSCMAAVLYSVVLNYLNKVVGNRYVSDKKIFFQGATARNKGLVAAFEQLLGVEVVVSPYAHVMGAWGAALLAQKQMSNTKKGERSTSFRGLDLPFEKVKLKEGKCLDCTNNCRITYAKMDGGGRVSSWGHMCGREKGGKTNDMVKSLDLIRKRDIYLDHQNVDIESSKKQVIGIPAVLANHSFLPLFGTFFRELDYEITVSSKTGQNIRQAGQKLVGAEFCYPVKIAHGHVQSMISNQKLFKVFIPHLIGGGGDGKNQKGHFCPYVAAQSSCIKSALKLNDEEEDKLLTPVLDLRLKSRQIISRLVAQLEGPLNRTPREIRKAWRKASEHQDRMEKILTGEGRRALDHLNETNEKAIVLVGRPYNIYDTGINNSLPGKLAGKGYKIIPIDFLSLQNERGKKGEHLNMYWYFGQRIISALQMIKENPNLYLVYLSNFGCGPDSFLLSYAQKIMGKKPYLILELDEHGAAAGYITRIEAFFDVLDKVVPSRQEDIQTFKPFSLSSHSGEMKKRTLWVPLLNRIGGHLLAANFRRHGFKSNALDVPQREAFVIGKKVTRGSECMPTALTIGSLIYKLREIKANPEEHAFFMPTASGPCRFGQYATLHRSILDQLGYQKLPMLSPSADNAYMGLDVRVRQGIYDAIIITDILIAMTCRIRPYEIEKGATDEVCSKQLDSIIKAMESGKNLEEALKRAVKHFASIKRKNIKKPLVGIVGEIYVRNSDFSNNSLVGTIEKLGGEAWPVSTAEWVIYTNYINQYPARKNFFKKILLAKDVLAGLYYKQRESRWHQIAQTIIGDRPSPSIEEIVLKGRDYFPVEFRGESILTIGRALKFVDDGVDMVVNCAPFGCMPGNLSTAVFQEIQSKVSIPVMNMIYDGETDLNGRLEVFLKQCGPDCVT